MKTSELRGKSADELNTILIDLKKEQLNLRFQKTTGELENTSRVRTVRRTVARIKTLLIQPDAVNAQPTKKKETTEKAAAKEEK